MTPKINLSGRRWFVLALLIGLISTSACLEIDWVTQPEYASPGETFSVTVAIHSEGTDPNPHAVFFTIRVPDSWQVLGVAYQSTKFGDGTLQLSQYWADSAEVVYPSPAGYHWQGFLTTESFLADAEKIDAQLTCRILTDSQTGAFTLDYTLGEDALGYDTNWGDVYDFSFGHKITTLRQLRVPGQFATIQAAIDAAQPGMQILISPGNYPENLQLKSGIQLEGTQAGVIIDGHARAHHADSSSLQQLTFQNAGSGNALLELHGAQISVKNCIFKPGAGETGIRCDSTQNLEVSGNSFQGNPATVVWGISSQVFVENNQIQTGATGLRFENSQVQISRNLITQCRTEAVRFIQTSGNFFNNTLSGNGHGLVLENSPATFFNNIIVSGDGVGISATGTAAIRYNNVWNNREGNYRNCTGGPGAISVDPLFVGGTPFSYQLTKNSPCIDAGDPASPLDRDGTPADLGAYYFPQPGIPSPIQKIYLVQFTHLDIGFTDPQNVVADRYKPIIDQALEYAETLPNFVWNIESIWQLEEWLSRSKPADAARLQNLINAGKIDICAGYANMHTAVLGTEELNRFLYPAEKFRQRFGLPINTVLQNDVPGFAWALPSVMASAGVKYLATGINDAFGGSAKLPKAHNPFYWQGPDGQKILTWINSGSYIEWWTKYYMYDFNKFFTILKDDLEKYEAAGYPYDAIMIMAGALENQHSTRLFSDLVTRWNATYTNPKLILARADEFFVHLEEKYGTQFPTYSGDWAGAWDLVSLNVPQSMSLARVTHDRINTAEKLTIISGLLAATPYPATEFNQIYRNLLQFDEHSGGGAPWPGTMTPAETQLQSEIAFNYAKNASDSTRLFLDAGLASLSEKIHRDGPGILVFNPLSWMRDDIACVHPDEAWQSRDFEVIDAATGAHVAHQWVDDNLLFFAPGVPSVGYKIFYLNPASLSEKQEPEIDANTPQLENQFYRITINPQDGTISSVYDKTHGRELVDSSAEFPFNGIIKATSMQAYSGDHSPVSLAATAIDPVVRGAVADILVIRRFVSPFVRAEIRLYHQVPQIEIINTSDRVKMEFVPNATNFEYYAYTFPFDLPGFETHLEGGAGFWNPATDHLPQAPRGAFAIQHGACLSSGNFSLDWTNREAFVLEFEHIHALDATFSPARATLISRFIKKEDEAKFEDGSLGLFDAEPGATSLIEMHYAFRTLPENFDATRTARFGWAFGNPFETHYFSNTSTSAFPDSGLSFFKIEPSNVFLVNVKRAEKNDGLILRLLEWEGRPTLARISSDYFDWHAASRTNAVEQDQQTLGTSAAGVQIQVGAHEMATVRANLSATRSRNSSVAPADQFRLEQNYPNPFNPATTIQYQLPQKMHVRITIYNLQGQQIRELVNDTVPAGSHSITWSGDNDQGLPVASGIYFYQLKTDDHILQRKLLFLK